MRDYAAEGQNSFSDRRAGVNDLAAYCTPVERVDSGYANLAHGSTGPAPSPLPSLFFFSFVASFQWNLVQIGVYGTRTKLKSVFHYTLHHPSD